MIIELQSDDDSTRWHTLTPRVDVWFGLLEVYLQRLTKETVRARLMLLDSDMFRATREIGFVARYEIEAGLSVWEASPLTT